jgi:hypothetical protein
MNRGIISTQEPSERYQAYHDALKLPQVAVSSGTGEQICLEAPSALMSAKRPDSTEHSSSGTYTSPPGLTSGRLRCNSLVTEALRPSIDSQSEHKMVSHICQRCFGHLQRRTRA